MTLRQAGMRFAAWMLFALLLFKSIAVTALWWEDRAAVQGLAMIWVYGLPVLVFIYFRYFSKLGCGGRCGMPGDGD